MNHNIEMKVKIAKVLKYVWITCFALTALIFGLGFILDLDNLDLNDGLLFLCIFSLFIASGVSFRIWCSLDQLCESKKLLYKFGLQDVTNDISTTQFNLPISKIFMGSRAFYAKKPATVLPYSMVVWVYVEQKKDWAVGRVVEEKVIFCCRDGSSFGIKANKNEMQTLLQVIHQFSPDLIIGYDENRKELYQFIVNNFSQQNK